MADEHVHLEEESPPLCERCGYDLRGIESDACPECGLARDSIAVPISDPMQFHIAKAALERAGLLVRSQQIGGVLGTLGLVHGLPNQCGWLWVPSHELERAERCLDAAGVPSPIGVLPIVDRSEPICPKCEAPLDDLDTDVCPNCGRAFQWVDIGEPHVSNTGRHCSECQYELTGNVSDICPECGSPIQPPRVDEIVEAATASEVATPSEPERRLLFNWRSFLKRFFLAIVFFILAAVFLGRASAQTLHISQDAIIGFLIVAFLIVIGYLFYQAIVAED